MANPNSSATARAEVLRESESIGSQSSGPAESIQETFRNASDRISSTFTDRQAAAELMDRATSKASDMYRQASSYVSENSRAFYMAGAFLAVGALGYFIGRSLSRSSYKDMPTL